MAFVAIKAADLAEFLITIIGYASQFGPRIAIKIMSNWMDAHAEITAEDFRALRANHRAPFDYLTEDQRRILGIPDPDPGE